MSTPKVKLTKFVSVYVPSTPNFIIHQDGKFTETVPIHLFSQKELKKIAKAWTVELLKKASKRSKS